MEKEENYIVVINGKPQGPYTLSDLKTVGITPTTFVRKRGMDDYKEAHAIPELRELLGFSYRQTAPQYFAGFDQRLLAVVIDYFLVTLAFGILLVIGFAFVTDKLGRIALLITYAPAIPVVKFLYSCIADASAKQGTIGKRLMNIRVTDMMGNRIDLARSIGRNFAKILSTLPVFFGYLYSFLNRKQQCFHDLIAETLVIKDRLV